MRDILILSKWFNGLEDAPDEVLETLGGRIIKELILDKGEIDVSNDDWNIKKIWLDIRKDVLGTYNSYKDKQEFGRNNGRKKDEEKNILIWKYCQENPNCKVADVGRYLESLNIDIKSKSAKGEYSKIYDMDGWKSRKDEGWLEKMGYSENSEEISEKSENKIGKSESNPAFNLF